MENFVSLQLKRTKWSRPFLDHIKFSISCKRRALYNDTWKHSDFEVMYGIKTWIFKMNLMGSWPPSILNVIHHIQTHMHFWKIPSRLALLKKTVYLWKCFLYRHSYNLYGTICFCWIALLLFQDWLFPIWFLRNYLQSFFLACSFWLHGYCNAM